MLFVANHSFLLAITPIALDIFLFYRESIELHKCGISHSYVNLLGSTLICFGGDTGDKTGFKWDIINQQS